MAQGLSPGLRGALVAIPATQLPLSWALLFWHFPHLVLLFSPVRLLTRSFIRAIMFNNNDDGDS